VYNNPSASVKKLDIKNKSTPIQITYRDICMLMSGVIIALKANLVTFVFHPQMSKPEAAVAAAQMR
jgi:hypothetical protein